MDVSEEPGVTFYTVVTTVKKHKYNMYIIFKENIPLHMEPYITHEVI
jgi:hypothetical protein